MSKLYCLVSYLLFLNLVILHASDHETSQQLGTWLRQPEHIPTYHATSRPAFRTDSGRCLIEGKEVDFLTWYRNFIEPNYKLSQQKAKYGLGDKEYYINGRNVSKEEYDAANQAQKEYLKRNRSCVIS